MKMRVQVAVPDHISGNLMTVAGSQTGSMVCPVCGLKEIASIRGGTGITSESVPLVEVEVEDVSLFDTGVDQPDAYQVPMYGLQDGGSRGHRTSTSCDAAPR
jgi:hypothetical protein